jgi:hypothetical protein
MGTHARSSTAAHDKLDAHSLMVDCIEVKEDLISDPTVIQEALQIVDRTKKHLVEIDPEKLRNCYTRKKKEKKFNQ